MNVGQAHDTLPGILTVAADGTVRRDAKRDGMYLIACLKEGNYARAAQYSEAGADVCVGEQARSHSCLIWT